MFAWHTAWPLGGIGAFLFAVAWVISVSGCWWLARNSGHSTGWAVFWGIVGGIVALPFYLIYYYRDRDNLTPAERLPLGFFGSGFSRRERACLGCGTVVPQGTKFCPSCGKELPQAGR